MGGLCISVGSCSIMALGISWHLLASLGPFKQIFVAGPTGEKKPWIPAPNISGLVASHASRMWLRLRKRMSWSRCLKSTLDVDHMKSEHWSIIDVLFPLVDWLIEGFVYPFNNRQMMIDGIPNRPLYFYQKEGHCCGQLVNQCCGSSTVVLPSLSAVRSLHVMLDAD